MTDYTMTVERYGRAETQIDIARFAFELADALGGSPAVTLDDCDKTIRSATITLADGLGLNVYANGYNSKGKVHIEATALDIAHDDRCHYMDKNSRMPDAHVSPERPMAVIAKDIKRRVIDPAAAPLAYRKDYALERQTARGGLAATVAALTAAVPEMVPDRNRASDSSRQDMWWHGPDIYLKAYAYNDGTVQIERMPSVTVAEFAEIAAIVRRRKGRQ